MRPAVGGASHGVAKATRWMAMNGLDASQSMRSGSRAMAMLPMCARRVTGVS